jgi:hypothetical protein
MIFFESSPWLHHLPSFREREGGGERMKLYEQGRGPGGYGILVQYWTCTYVKKSSKIFIQVR